MLAGIGAGDCHEVVPGAEHDAAHGTAAAPTAARVIWMKRLYRVRTFHTDNQDRVVAPGRPARLLHPYRRRTHHLDLPRFRRRQVAAVAVVVADKAKGGSLIAGRLARRRCHQDSQWSAG